MDILDKIFPVREKSSSSSKNRNSKEKRMTLDTLYQQQKGICGICKLSVAKSMATIDHVIPLSRGGAWRKSNLQMTHWECNLYKSNDFQSEIDEAK